MSCDIFVRSHAVFLLENVACKFFRTSPVVDSAGIVVGIASSPAVACMFFDTAAAPRDR